MGGKCIHVVNMAYTKLGMGLKAMLDCASSDLDQVLQETPEALLELSIEQFAEQHDDLLMKLIGRLTAGDARELAEREEPTSQILTSSVRAIFAYGTLRADFSPNGDSWGVISQIKRKHGADCKWTRGRVNGYALYQNMQLDYPLATPSAD